MTCLPLIDIVSIPRFVLLVRRGHFVELRSRFGDGPQRRKYIGDKFGFLGLQSTALHPARSWQWGRGVPVIYGVNESDGVYAVPLQVKRSRKRFRFKDQFIFTLMRFACFLILMATVLHTWGLMDALRSRYTE
jgi:hypothetical protein